MTAPSLIKLDQQLSSTTSKLVACGIHKIQRLYSEKRKEACLIYPIALEIRYHVYRKVCLIFISWWPPRYWQWKAVENVTLRQNRRFQFSHYELSIYMKPHSSSTYIMRRYSRACGSYHDFFDTGLLTRNLLNQGFVVLKLKSSLCKFYSPHNYLVNTKGYLCHK